MGGGWGGRSGGKEVGQEGLGRDEEDNVCSWEVVSGRGQRKTGGVCGGGGGSPH